MRRTPLRLDTGAMRTTDQFTPTASGPETLGDAAVEIVPLISTVFAAGPPVLALWLGTIAFALLLVGPFVLIVTLVVALAAVAAVVALAGAILATPVLVIRHLQRRHAERGQRSERWAPIAPVTLRAAR